MAQANRRRGASGLRGLWNNPPAQASVRTAMTTGAMEESTEETTMGTARAQKSSKNIQGKNITSFRGVARWATFGGGTKIAFINRKKITEF